jgi:hypothetical protein
MLAYKKGMVKPVSNKNGKIGLFVKNSLKNS